jgi:hypothetical protein
MSYTGYFVVGKIFLRILKEAIVGNETDAAQQEQVQNGVQCSVSWLCLLWLMGDEMLVSALTVHSSLSPHGKQDSPNK